MTFRQGLYERAARSKRTVVLAEGADARVREAARVIEHNVADVIVVDDCGGDDRLDRVVDLIAQRAKPHLAKEAPVLALDPVWFAVGLVALGEADCAVAGATHATGHVIRAALNLVGVAADASRISSAFYMVWDRSDQETVLTFTDAGVNPDPSADELVEIAAAAADDRRYIVGDEPVVAFLSYSTKGSAQGPRVDKMRRAAEQFRSLKPDIRSDGEMQADAALIPNIARRKAAESAVQGDANILVFPDLDSGNIAYKLIQRLAGCAAIGPILQGLAKPVADVSRGASSTDIVDVAAIAVLQAAR